MSSTTYKEKMQNQPSRCRKWVTVCNRNAMQQHE